MFCTSRASAGGEHVQSKDSLGLALCFASGAEFLHGPAFVLDSIDVKINYVLKSSWSSVSWSPALLSQCFHSRAS